MRKSLVILLAVLALLALSVLPALAITYGTPDGNGHPNTGAFTLKVVRADGSVDYAAICTGTLIAPKVFLTASHCTDAAESWGYTEAYVSFEPQVTASSKVYRGRMVTNPNYNQAQDDSGDIAVILLDEAPKGITPAKLPTKGFFDDLAAKNGLKGSTYTAVGYGIREPETAPGGITHADDQTRYVSTAEFNALNAAWLRLSQVNATGAGGTCNGDSGGPNFFGTTEMIAGITITGDMECFATNVIYRLDTEGARSFLAPYVKLP